MVSLMGFIINAINGDKVFGMIFMCLSTFNFVFLPSLPSDILNKEEGEKK